MKKKTKIVIGIVILVVIALIWFLVSIVDKEENIEIVEEEITIDLSIELDSNSAYLKNSEGEILDTLSVPEEFGEIIEANNVAVAKEIITSKKFITSNDINFDGVNDIAVLDGIGYGGLNFFYNYFVVNTETNTFEDYALPHVGNPIFDTENGKITSIYRSGPQWITEEYYFTRDGYEIK